jgi:hypothetical protein
MTRLTPAEAKRGLAHAFEIDDIHITAHYLNHPALNLGYRMEMGGTSVVYACDHKPHSRNPWQNVPVHELDRLHGEFLRDTDLVIHDAQFRPSIPVC